MSQTSNGVLMVQRLLLQATVLKTRIKIRIRIFLLLTQNRAQVRIATGTNRLRAGKEEMVPRNGVLTAKRSLSCAAHPMEILSCMINQFYVPFLRKAVNRKCCQRSLTVLSATQN